MLRDPGTGKATPRRRTQRIKMKKRIMIAEDEPSIRESLARVLESEDYDVESANTGEEAIAKFHARPCDLVLLDLNMPAKDGWAAYQGISRLRPLVPVIVITARPHQYKRAVGVGVDALMEKPLDLPLLLQCVRDLLAEPKAARVARLMDPNFTTRFLSDACDSPPDTPGGKSRTIPLLSRGRLLPETEP